ncbi:ATP-binding protein [Actinocorallia libanotica]|uniref:Histidine kinase/HSP90-like ATPase domain-containing protein n=1 Tax=Actinocorallia libanotica TaxID=46162 RepID=A0ABP4B8A5_9ACTN
MASDIDATYIPQRPDRTKFYFQNFAVPWTLEDVNDVRHRVAAVLRDWEIDTGFIDDRITAVHEMVTNAYCHGEPPILLSLLLDDDGLLVEVADRSPEMPERRRPGIEDLRGRGLILIEDAARAMGWRAVREGKVVWARF